jgi:hypothetical protein
MPAKDNRPISVRLLERCIKNSYTGCLEWQGTTSKGYGKIRIGKGVSVHRAAYEAWVGPIPDGKFVCNTCKNKRCCNPEHLFLGSHENTKHLARIALENRFWSRVEKLGSEDCWPCSGGKDKDGYGQIFRPNGVGEPGTNLRMHRLCWEISNGPIPKGKLVCHHCDNPPCCNPNHLFLGGQLENKRDSIAKGRHIKGEKQSSAKLTADLVVEIRKARAADQMRGSRKAIAKRFGVTDTTIGDVYSRKTWKHIP